MNSLKRVSIALFVIVAAVMSLSASSPRNILIEEFTNASNTQDASQNPTLQQFLFPIVSQGIIPISFHPDYSNSDAITAGDTAVHRGRARYYNITAAPLIRVNGITPTASSSSFTDGVAADTIAIKSSISNYNAETSPYTITTTQTKQSDGSIKIDVKVKSDIDINGKKYLRVAIAEGYHYYKGGAGFNGEQNFYYIARGMFPNTEGTLLNITAGSEGNYSFTYKPSNDLYVKSLYTVAFIQDDNSKEVLQAGASSIPNVANSVNAPKVEPGIVISEPYSKIPAATTSTFDVKFTNPTNHDITVQIGISPGLIPATWQYSFDKNSLTLPANGIASAKLSVTPTSVAGYGGLSVTVQPIGLQDSVPVLNFSSIGKITDNTEYLYGTGIDANGQPTFNSTQKYLGVDVNKMALIPIADVTLLNSFDFSEYRLLITTIDANNSFFVGQNVPQTVQFVNQLEKMLNSGKGVFISSELYASTVFSTNTNNPSGEELFKKYIGITSPGYFTLLNQSGNLFTLFLSGTQDFIAQGLKDTINQNYSSIYPYYCTSADALVTEPTFAGKQTPIVNYIDATNKEYLGGVRSEINTGRIVYFGFGLQGIADESKRDKVVGNAIEWLLNASHGGKISATATTVDFKNVAKGNTKDSIITITNTGTDKLEIYSLTLENNADNVYSIKNQSGLISIPAGGTYPITVSFSPKAEQVYNAKLTINSNDADNVNFSIDLTGNGNGVQSVEDENMTKAVALSAAPNPVINTSNVTFNIKSNAPVAAKLYLMDPTGRTAAVIFDGIASPGINTATINSNNLATGKYFLVGEYNGETNQIPINIVK